MSIQETVLPPRKGGRLLLVGNGVAQACALARYTLLARLLGPEQLGLSVTLILTAQFFDSVSESGSDRFLIQDRHGDEPRAQALVQLLSVVRGFVIAGLLLVLARPIAGFYREPILAAGLMGLAIAPIITGFFNFDLRRVQRHNDFGREGLAMMVAEVTSLAATILAAWVTRSYIAALVGLTVRAVAMVAVSQLTAERPYRIGYAPEHAKRLATFAAPLMVNGLLLFLTSQGDRLLVGRQLGVSDLGKYSAVLLLIYYPSMMLMRYFHTMQLPLVAAAGATRDGLMRAIDDMASAALLLSLAMAAGFAVVAPIAVPLLFGHVFAQPVIVIAAIGALQVCRFIRIWPTTAALAAGKSGAVLAANLARLIAFPAAAAGVWLAGGLFGLTLGFAAGELVGVGIAVAITNRALGLPLMLDAGRVAALTLGCTAIMATAWCVDRMTAATALSAAAVTAVLLGAIAWRERDTIARLMAMMPGARSRARGTHA